jgi:hypothetical protein
MKKVTLQSADIKTGSNKDPLPVFHFEDKKKTFIILLKELLFSTNKSYSDLP